MMKTILMLNTELFYEDEKLRLLSDASRSL